MPLLDVRNLKKIYTTRFGGNQVQALSDVSFSVESGEFIAIMGESGSGKTTLLNILASLDKPTSGEVFLEGRPMSGIRDNALAAFRRDHLGFVFQDFNLLDTFSLQDNIFLPLVLGGRRHREMAECLAPIARGLGIEDILSKYPYEVSGGQKQRAAIARALITNPRLVLADEPTGALDSRASDQLLRLFRGINAGGQTVLMVTHSIRAASHANRVLFIKDGSVSNQVYRGDAGNEAMYVKISDALAVMQAEVTAVKHDIFFFPRLAAVNLRKNQQTYLPFLLSVTGCFAAVFMLANIAYGPGISDLPGGDALLSMLTFGIAVLCLFSVAFILYTNSFLMKRRKRELALYAILGLERRHVARTLFWESLYAYLLTTAAGLLTGVLLGKLMFLLMLRIVRYPTALDYTPSPLLALITIAAFGGVFLIVLLTNLVRIGHASRSRFFKVRTQENGNRALLADHPCRYCSARMGILDRTHRPVSATSDGTIFCRRDSGHLGTFALFTSGSVRVLKTLRTWRRFYYRTRNFVSVSGMIYRMKQNAAGLASSVSQYDGTGHPLDDLALYAGLQENINLYYPTDMALSWPAEQGPQEDMIGRIRMRPSDTA